MTDPLIRRSAVLSECGAYRYELRRTWDDSLPLLVVCMLNPSSADADRDDPTVRELIHFATLWGYGGLLIVNLFAFRSSSPAAMRETENPIGKENPQYTHAALEYARQNGGRLLAAWGNDGALDTLTCDARDEWFCSWANRRGVTLISLGTTSSWRPKHPMARGRHRIARDQQPIIWREAIAREAGE